MYVLSFNIQRGAVSAVAKGSEKKNVLDKINERMNTFAMKADV